VLLCCDSLIAYNKANEQQIPKVGSQVRSVGLFERSISRSWKTGQGKVGGGKKELGPKVRG